MTEPPCTFFARYHRPSLYRYEVADHGFRVVRNRYANPGGSAFIGLAVVLGRWAWCIKWADARIRQEKIS